MSVHKLRENAACISLRFCCQDFTTTKHLARCAASGDEGSKLLERPTSMAQVVFNTIRRPRTDFAACADLALRSSIMAFTIRRCATASPFHRSRSSEVAPGLSV